MIAWLPVFTAGLITTKYVPPPAIENDGDSGKALPFVHVTVFKLLSCVDDMAVVEVVKVAAAPVRHGVRSKSPICTLPAAELMLSNANQQTKSGIVAGTGVEPPPLATHVGLAPAPFVCKMYPAVPGARSAHAEPL